MTKSTKNLDPEILRSEISYDPETGAMQRRGFCGNAVGPVYIDPNGGKPVFTLTTEKYYVLGAIAIFLWGEFVPKNRIHIIDGNPMNLKAANYRRMTDEKKYCPKCQTFYTGPPKSREPNISYRRRCAACMKNPSYIRTYTLQKYNLTPESYGKLLVAQGGVCQICKQVETKKTTDLLCVDHCHTTGKVRALLCSKCNSGLGQFGNNPRLLLEAAQYLLNHKT